MDQIIRIGIDTSKQIFQLHGVNAAEANNLSGTTRDSLSQPRRHGRSIHMLDLSAKERLDQLRLDSLVIGLVPQVHELTWIPFKIVKLSPRDPVEEAQTRPIVDEGMHARC